MKKIIYTIAMLSTSLGMHGQEKLSLDDAIGIALEKNFDIRIETENVKLSDEELSHGNAGYYPSIFAEAGYEYSINSMKAEYEVGMLSGGDDGSMIVEGDGATSSTFNAGVGLSYDLFEGGAKKFRYKQLETSHALSELQLNNQIEMSIVEVGAAYLELARLKTSYELSIENMEISKERAQRAEVNAEYGAISDLMLLQSLTFLNNDSVEYRKADVDLKNAKRKLNLALGRDAETAVDVYTEVEILHQMDKDALVQKMMDNNSLIKMGKGTLGLSENALKLAKAAYYPTLSLSGQYGYFKQDNELNMITMQQSLGFTGGATLSIPIFTGNQRRTMVNTAQIRIDQSKMTLDKTVATVKTNLLDSYEQYNFFITQLAIEERNIALYKKNFTKASDEFDNGIIGSTEVRESQNSFVRAKDRIYNLIYNIKLYEMILNQLSGDLVSPEVK